MRRFLVVCQWTLMLILCANNTYSSTPPLPDVPQSHVVDLAGIVSDSDKLTLNNYLQKLEEKTSSKMLIVSVLSLDGDSIELFSSKALEKWNLKSNSKSILFTVATKDRKYRLEVGSDLESKLPDAFIGFIGREYIVPHFKSGNYSTGVVKTTEAVIQSIIPNEIVKSGDDPSARWHATTATTPKEDHGSNILSFLPALILVTCGIVLFFVRQRFAGVGFFVGCLLGFLFRPSAFLVGQLPFTAVISRGGALSGLDLLLIPVAQSSFNIMAAVSIIGALTGAGIEYFVTKKKIVDR